MAQLGFFDADKRLEALSAKGDPLEAIDRLVPWESFRAEIEAVVLTPDELKKSSAGRKPFDAMLMFRMLVLQALNNLSDEQVEYQVRDRLSFSRSRRACVRVAAERAGRSDRANDRHYAGARQDRLAEPDLQHSPPGDAGTARRGMKVKSLCSFNRSSGRDGAAKTGLSIQNSTRHYAPHAAKSTIVRGAHAQVASRYHYSRLAICQFCRTKPHTLAQMISWWTSAPTVRCSRTSSASEGTARRTPASSAGA